jgi:PAS domain S-box-containing protein
MTNADLAGRGITDARIRPNELDLRVILDTIPGFVWTMTATGEVELVNRQMLDYFGARSEELKNWSSFLHEDDRARVIVEWTRTIETTEPYQIEHRLRRADGVYRWFQARGLALRDGEGRVTRWYNLLTDIDDRKRAEELLRTSEQNLRLIVDSIPGFVITATPSGELELANLRMLTYFGKTLEELKEWSLVIHPDDRPLVVAAWAHSVQTGDPHDTPQRLLGADGIYRWFHVRASALRNGEGEIQRWYALFTDIDESKQAEAKLRRSEWNLLEAQRLGHSGSWSLDVASGIVTGSPEMRRVFGATAGDDPSQPDFWFDRIHPEDRPRVRELFEQCVAEKREYQADYRLLLPDGTIRHQHSRGNPIVNAAGHLVEFVGTAIDTTDHALATAELQRAFDEIKRLKDRLHDENIALREQIDQVFMFEEIVGSSAALKEVLSSVVKVAPTDSTVLITGETGTGKELVARAIHKRSQRASRAFVSVNCAAIPSSLIASELFGHEKGAFTGAMQQRRGRFELAHSGSIFLDEVGELPHETQIALLRVLQERQFERVGSDRVISTNVRVIAATNRDLSAAIAAGAFRADLFYRLNVFPIEIPPLRKRRDDIPLLVEYFVQRFSDKMGKHIRKIDKDTLARCRAYDWPGNIRELQNIVERSVILCTGSTFRVEKAWLSAREPSTSPAPPLTEALQHQEKQIIEAALAAAHGKVAGPRGAAVRLGVPPSTLEWKIKQLKIQKRKFITTV